MKLNLIETKEILDFEKEIGQELEVNERRIHKESNSRLKRYYAHFKDCDVVNGVMLIGSYGDGDTIDEAIRDYCNEISNRRVVFGAFTPNRKEMLMPKLVHTYETYDKQ